jgi:hypothetical protein
VENELVKTIRYIEERERTLSRYSDKLRRAVERIFNVFGKPSECQVCGYGETRYLHFKYYYYPDEREEYHTCYSVKVGVDEVPAEVNGMRTEVLEVDEALDADTIDVKVKSFDKDRKVWFVFKNPKYHRFMPKVFVSIDVEDGVPFYSVGDEEAVDEYYLALRKHELVIVMRTRYKNEAWTSGAKVYGVDQVSREVLKALVKSGRLLEFLKTVSEKLQKMSEEYREVSEIAEKMAKAIES